MRTRLLTVAHSRFPFRPVPQSACCFVQLKAITTLRAPQSATLLTDACVQHVSAHSNQHRTHHHHSAPPRHNAETHTHTLCAYVCGSQADCIVHNCGTVVVDITAPHNNCTLKKHCMQTPSRIKQEPEHIILLRPRHTHAFKRLATYKNMLRST